MEVVKRAGAAPPRLSPDDWSRAALVAIAEGGLSAVAVESLAQALGATKGSFYWHFENRDALLAAALARWLERDTMSVIRRLEAIDDPRTRLRALFAEAFAERLGGRVDAALLADAAHPVVAPVLRRATDARLQFMEDAFSALGFPPAAARDRALLAYTAYVGLFQLRRAAPEAVPSGRRLEGYLRSALPSLLEEPAAASST